MICVGLTIVYVSAGIPSNVTDVTGSCPANLVPVIVTVVPPSGGPVAGVISLIEGEAAEAGGTMASKLATKRTRMRLARVARRGLDAVRPFPPSRFT